MLNDIASGTKSPSVSMSGVFMIPNIWLAATSACVTLPSPSLAEFRRFVAAVPEAEISPDLGRMMLCAAWTGSRVGELLALRWDDYVDGELRIERSVWRRKEKATRTS